MRRHFGLMGMAAALAMLGRSEVMPRYHPVLPEKGKRPRRPVNARLNKTHRLKGVRP